MSSIALVVYGVLVVYFITMSKRFLLWGGVVVGLFLIVLAVVKLSDTAQGPSNDVVPEVNTISEYDHVKGNRGASIVLVEYSDLQCPACRAYYPMIKQLADENGERIAVIYRHFPLTSIHKNAEPAARAAVAAAEQGKFWEMHDLLFEKQRFWSEEKDIETLLKQYANDLGLDSVRFSNDFASRAAKEKVENDQRSGNRAAILGTPTFFVNGKRINNPRSFDELRTAVLGNN